MTEGLSIRQVSKTYRGFVALDSVNFDLNPGITGLVGENGAGKTTLLNVASGRLKPREGHVSVNGYDPYLRRERRSALSNMALMPQSGTAPQGFTTLEFVEYVTWLRGVSHKVASERALEAIQMVELSKVADRKMRTLSGGMQRRAWLAQAIAAGTDILLLDEPSSGLDPRQRNLMIELLLRLHARHILISSHLIEDLDVLVNDVIVLEKGAITYFGERPANFSTKWYLENSRTESIS